MRVGLMVAVLALAVSAPAMAQVTPAVEIGLGYSYLRDDEIDEDLPLGWYADIAGNVTSSFALVGEIGGNYKTIDSGIGDDTLDIHLSVHTAMGGLRLTHRGDGANFYLQVLAGAAKAKVSVLDEGDSVTDFAVQPGVGLEFGTGGSVGFRLGADYRRVFSDPDGVNQWRATAGFVIRVGER
jgi:outer membrane protein with beta-barrel domain